MSAERKALEKQRNEYNELKRQFDKCRLAPREELQEQLSRVSVSATLSRVLPNGTALCHLQRAACDAASRLEVFLYMPFSCASVSFPPAAVSPQLHTSASAHCCNPPLCLHSSFTLRSRKSQTAAINNLINGPALKPCMVFFSSFFFPPLHD